MEKSRLDLFREFFSSEKAGGFILIGATIISLIIANGANAAEYIAFWHSKVDLSFAGIELNYSVEHWVNDGLMTIFFLLVGLEIERELYVGELSDFRNALLPVIAALGGMLFPALIHFVFNAGTPAQIGFGIPMATDIAFALGILSLAGNRVPVALKIFLTALAIIDDLGAITVIAVFYTKGFSTAYFLAAIALFLVMFVAGKRKLYSLFFYIPLGIVMWYCMLKSGVHASIAGVLLAFAIPFHKEDDKNPSYWLQHKLHYPVAFIILPLFALANTAIQFPQDLKAAFANNNALGIIFGLIVGKFVGIFLLSFVAVKTGIARIGAGLRWLHIAGIAFLGGIGFTMSIFISNLAFDDGEMITNAKMSVLAGSLIAALVGLLMLRGSQRNAVPAPGGI